MFGINTALIIEERTLVDRKLTAKQRMLQGCKRKDVSSRIEPKESKSSHFSYYLYFLAIYTY